MGAVNSYGPSQTRVRQPFRENLGIRGKGDVINITGIEHRAESTYSTTDPSGSVRYGRQDQLLTSFIEKDRLSPFSPGFRGIVERSIQFGSVPDPAHKGDDSRPKKGGRRHRSATDDLIIYLALHRLSS